MVGILVSFWDGLFSGANCLFQGGYLQTFEYLAVVEFLRLCNGVVKFYWCLLYLMMRCLKPVTLLFHAWEHRSSGIWKTRELMATHTIPQRPGKTACHRMVMFKASKDARHLNSSCPHNTCKKATAAHL